MDFKGYTQKPSIDYEDTYSPVAKFISIRTLMAIVGKPDLKSYQMDAKVAFLDGKLRKEIYMENTNFEITEK